MARSVHIERGDETNKENSPVGVNDMTIALITWPEEVVSSL